MLAFADFLWAVIRTLIELAVLSLIALVGWSYLCTLWDRWKEKQRRGRG